MKIIQCKEKETLILYIEHKFQILHVWIVMKSSKLFLHAVNKEISHLCKHKVANRLHKETLADITDGSVIYSIVDIIIVIT